MTRQSDDTPADEDVCGETYDHEEVVDYEGDDGVQWHCSRCGAEGWADADEGE